MQDIETKIVQRWRKEMVTHAISHQGGAFLLSVQKGDKMDSECCQHNIESCDQPLTRQSLEFAFYIQHSFIKRISSNIIGHLTFESVQPRKMFLWHRHILLFVLIPDLNCFQCKISILRSFFCQTSFFGNVIFTIHFEWAEK